jgi:hypothetical protein
LPQTSPQAPDEEPRTGRESPGVDAPLRDYLPFIKRRKTASKKK